MDATQAAAGRRAMLRQEAMIGIGLNALLSIIFFFLIFGWNPVPNAKLALDFFPQTFGIAVCGTIVPTILTLHRIARGTVLAAGSVPTRPVHGLRVIGIAAVMTAVAGGCAAASLALIGPEIVSPSVAVAIKAVYGAIVGIPLTLSVLRSVLGMPFLPGQNRVSAQV